MASIFKEDFFERVVDVQWQSEKKCYFMAGDAFPIGGIDNYGCKLYTSEDGMHWDVTAIDPPDRGKLYGFTSGLWMRESFDPRGRPLWIMGGEGVEAAAGYRKAGIQISTDGKSLGESRWFDKSHFVGQFFVDGGGQVGSQARLESTQFFHADTFTSSSGLIWSPDHYHDGTLLSVDAAPPPPAAISHIPTPFNFLPSQMRVSNAAPSPSAVAQLTKIATQAATEKKIPIRDIYQLSNRSAATGTLREGKYAGQVVTIEMPDSHGFHGPGTPGADYFGPKAVLTDAKTGKQLGTSSTKVPLGSSIAYGYYVFVVIGGDSKDISQCSTVISYTEDGRRWHSQTLNLGHRGWSLVVGARPEEN